MAEVVAQSKASTIVVPRYLVLVLDQFRNRTVYPRTLWHRDRTIPQRGFIDLAGMASI